jgi:hypothetical protein
MNEVRRNSPVLEALVDLFFESAETLGEFEEVASGSLPSPYGELLDHHEHMTVTVERFHGCPVNVQVLDLRTTKTHYSRKIALTRQSDGRVVQFGIVRLCLDFLEPPVRAEIESQSAPLGRVLIKHNVLREVQLISLWKVAAGEELASLFSCDADAVTYGRTALIYCNGVPAVELLEIVAPV